MKKLTDFDRTEFLEQLVYFMIRKTMFLSSLLCISLFYSQQPLADEQPLPPKPSCSISDSLSYFSLRHLESRGVGYNQGYTSLDGFFAFTLHSSSYVPFLDLRGHIFNNGDPAANLGIGVRWGSSRVFGMNAYYDYRKNRHHSFNQIAGGLESLGKIWDFRLNGYFPVGNTKGSLYHTQFAGFKDHHMILSSRKDFAMKGGNAEVGAHVTKKTPVGVYTAGGVYYFTNEGKNALGGQARIVCDFLKYLRLEGNVSYDNVFKGIVQGQFSFVVPFEKLSRRNSDCPPIPYWANRKSQRIDRNEIIVLDRIHKKHPARDPATGNPLVFCFVDNTSHSKGTFASPFNTLLDAQMRSSHNEIIYVFPGDGTLTGMDTGIILQNDQRLLGAAMCHSIATNCGTIQVPALATVTPTVVNSMGPEPAITLAHNTKVAGINTLDFYSISNNPHGSSELAIFGIRNECFGIGEEDCDD